MNDFEGMTEDQQRILHLEAKVLQMQCQIIAIRQTVLSYFQMAGVRIGQTPADIYNTQVQQKVMKELLCALSDMDPDRASKISRILLPPKTDS